MTDSFAPLIGRLADPRPLTWLFVGDSITHGIWHTAGGRSYVEHVQEIVRGDRWRIHDTFINAAVSGTNILETLDDFELRVERHHADFVFTLIGTNDSATDREIPVPQFRAGLDEFTTRVQGTGAQLILQTPPPVSPRLDPRRAGLPEYADAIRSVAGEHRVPLIDHEHAWQAATQGMEGIAWEWLSDAIHPNAAGHAAMALLVLDQLGPVADTTCRRRVEQVMGEPALK